MRLEYFPEGSEDCPLILIYGNKRQDFQILLDVFNDLSLGKRDRVFLSSLPGFEVIDGIELLCIWGKDRGAKKVSDYEFEWCLDSRGWDQIAGSVEPFVEIKDLTTTSFQFLDLSGPLHIIVSTTRSW